MLSLIRVLICALIAVLCVWTTWLDWQTGEIGLRKRRGHPRTMLRRVEYPLVFMTLLVVKVAAALLLILLVSGWFFTWVGFR